MTSPPESSLDIRPRLIDIWKWTRFDSGKLACLAGVDEVKVILTMFRGYPVLRSDAEKVLAALSQMLPGNYSLETVRVVLVRG